MPFRSSLDLIESALRTGRRNEAVAHARAIAASGLTQVSPSFGLLTLAAAASVAEDHAEAEALFVRALSVPGADDLEWDQARVRLLFGERLRRARAVTQARAPLEAALAAFERMGATPWAARAARELEATAATRTRVHASGKSSLTPQEMQVAALAAAGLSNKQIGEKLLMSHRTVGAHLSRVYGKLGVSGRAALSAALADIEAER
ncbi:helix-turn-helix transcriptional regulator [Paractinoplanes brasiliensis]|uniref:helix-turn-helix transcriptional regulator n=1 Tax=Paractinoplanes brasiliensis TaxID=52695 RepID=UPI001414D13D|nr:helix-turn-helix transcriptional regulator [Actinoplanes brasiliensis]GID33412.1 hypothetical protein Abr02nite_83950 [Actinoplanes brasiliensis]